MFTSIASPADRADEAVPQQRAPRTTAAEKTQDARPKAYDAEKIVAELIRRYFDSSTSVALIF